MIDLLYYWRDNGYDATNVAEHFRNYSSYLGDAVGYHGLDSMVAAYDFTQGLGPLIRNIYNYAKSIINTNNLIKDGENLVTNASYSTICQKLYDDVRKSNSWADLGIIPASTPEYTSYRDRYLEYIFAYNYWINRTAEDMFKCILNNSAIGDTEYVGIRTKEYFKAMGVDQCLKRFGTPTSREAHPLCFRFKDVALNSPPMTTRSHSSEVIDVIYGFFGYVGTRKVILASGNKFVRMCSDHIVGEAFIPLEAYKLASTFGKYITSYSNIIPSYVYDLFFMYYLKTMTGVSVTYSNVIKSELCDIAAHTAYNFDVLNRLYYDYGASIMLPDLVNLIY